MESSCVYKKSEMMFDETKKRVCMQISEGGNQLVKLEILGEINNEETVLYIERNGIEAKRKR